MKKEKKFSFPDRVAVVCPEIDAGKFGTTAFNNAFWKKAFSTGSFYKRGVRIYEKEWGSLLPEAPIPTTLALARDAENLYVGIQCIEPEPDKTKLHYRKNRTEVWLDDSIELFFDPRHGHCEFYQLLINSGGFYHAFHRKTNREKVRWDPGISSRCFSWEHGWGIEIALALDSFPVPLKDTSVWGFNAGRNFGVTQRDDRVETSLAPLHAHGWDRPSRFADLHFVHKPVYVKSIILNGRNVVNADKLFISPELHYGDNALRITLRDGVAGRLRIRSRVGTVQTSATAKGNSLRTRLTVPRTAQDGDQSISVRVESEGTVLFDGSWHVPLPSLIELRRNLLFPSQSEIAIGAGSAFLRDKVLRITAGNRSAEQPARRRQRLRNFFVHPSRARTTYTVTLLTPKGTRVAHTTQTFPAIPAYLVPDHPRLSGPHPRLFFTESDPSSVRDRIHASDTLSADYKEIKAQAEHFLATFKQPPLKSAAGLTWYRCYEHGARLEHLPDGRHRCPVGGEIHEDIRLDLAWLFWEHGVNLENAARLAFLYWIEGDQRFRDMAKDILLWYGTHYLKFDYCNGPDADTLAVGGMRGSILAESGLITLMGLAYDLLYDDLTTEERKAVRQNCFEPVCDQMMRYPGGKGNWKTHLNNALTVIGTVTGRPEYIATALGDRRGFFFDMHTGVTPGGFWHQGAIGYHFYVLSAYQMMAEFLLKAHGSNLYGNSRFRKMFLAPLQYAYPDFSLPNIGTGGGGQLPRYAGIYELAASRIPALQPYGKVMRKWFSENRGGEFLLRLLRLTAPETVLSQDQPESTLFSSINFTGIGYGILRDRTDGAVQQLTFVYGKTHEGKGQPDKLSFDLYGKNRLLAPDPGYMTYRHPLTPTWYYRTIAHNSVVQDLASQQYGEAPLLGYLADRRLQAIGAVSDNIYPGVNATRIMTLSGDLLFDFFLLSGPEAHTFDYFFHHYGKPSVVGGTRKCPEPIHEIGGYPHISRLRRGKAVSNCWDLRWSLGGGIKTVTHFRTFPETELFTGQGPRYGGDITDAAQDIPIPLAFLRAKSEQALFVTVMEIGVSRQQVNDVRVSGPRFPIEVRCMRQRTKIAWSIEKTRLVYREDDAVVAQVPFSRAIQLHVKG